MEKILKKETHNTPFVYFDTNVLQIRGKSIMEHPYSFYIELIDYVIEYIKNPETNTIVNIKLEYMNTASSKYFIIMLTELKKINNVIINWFYEDDDILEDGEIFENIVKIPFNFIKLEEE